MKKFFKLTTLNLTLSILSLIIFSNISFAAGPTAYVGNIYTLFEEAGDPTQCVLTSTTSATDVSFLTAGTFGDCTSTDPWVCSALIEFDQPKATTAYPDHCLALCANITCVSTDTAGGNFPINEFTFEVFKFEGQVGGNLEDENVYPTIRSISLDTSADINGVVECVTGTGVSTMTFCTAWDGHYPFEGNFAKTNGQFGFRARMAVDYPGDGINFDRITIDDVSAYPGVNQIPIQVDVSDIHSVTSSTTIVGTSPAVAASPYFLNYRLSKESTVSIDIYDANSADVIDTLFIPAGGSGYVNGETVTLLGSVGSTNGTGTATVVAGGGVFAVTAVTVTDGGTGHAVGNTITIQGSGSGAVGSVTTVSAIAVNPDRTLITNQPRTGEGIPTPSILNSDAWDGRNDTGRLLPAGNYLAYITAQSFDEFDYNTTGTADVARSKTHQISLDPLQITDVAITGLAQQSTSYAKIDLLLTESAKVYWEIYEPGTEVTTLYTGTLGGGTLTAPGIGPVVPSGSLVARYVEQKPLRTPEDLKWDGTCNATATVSACNTGATYGLGVPLADGNYPYALWAEIPYETGANTENVKTVQYYTGYIPVERGLVETTVNSIGYTTVGSSPTAYNIDPFVFQYSINRDALVDMKILTNDGAEAVRTLFTTQTVQGSFQNQEVWNGIDDTGRYVGPGTYMLQIVTQDALFPTEPTKRTTTTVFFPVDLFRVVDVEATNLLGGEGETADISYTLSKSMQAYLRIYALGTEIPTNGQWPPSIATIGTPIKTFAGALLPGENLRITELWDGLDDNGNVLPDGEYPFFIEAKTPATTEVAVYYDANGDSQTVTNTASYPATDRVTGFVKIVRGQIEFKTDSLKSVATKPTLIYTSENVSTPPYEIQFEVLQEAEVSVEILATAASSSAVCPAEGDTCRTLTKTAGEVFDADLVHSLFWDAKDSNGAYVPTGAYRVKFSALDHPDNLQDANIRYLNQVVDYEVYDIERTFISPQSPTALIGYQVGVPMKVGIQIFKPGTGIQADGTLLYQGAAISSVNEVLVKSIVGLRTERIGLEDFWDGSDFALQTVPDGNYIFRFVTSTDYRAIDSVTGGLATGYTVSSLADLEAYGTSYNIEVGSGDSGFVCDDWENYTIFYPNPLRQATGTMEVTKIPIPGNVSIKVYNLAADLVRSRNYECIDLDGNTQTMTESLSVQPNFTFSSPSGSTTTLRNAELRCTWDKKNNHGKNVARGIYFVMTEFKATSGGGQHCFAVEKVLIP